MSTMLDHQERGFGSDIHTQYNSHRPCLSDAVKMPPIRVKRQQIGIKIRRVILAF